MRYVLDEPRSLGDLIRDLRDEAIFLFRQEIHLAKKETAENVGRVGRNVGFLAAGALVAFSGLLIFLAALSVLLAVGLAAAGVPSAHAIWIGPGVIGLLVLAVGVGLCLKAINTLKEQPLKPRRTIETLKEEREWVREKTGR